MSINNDISYCLKHIINQLTSNNLVCYVLQLVSITVCLLFGAEQCTVAYSEKRVILMLRVNQKNAVVLKPKQ